MERLTKYVAGVAHGAEGRTAESLNGSYCRGEFEATAIVDRLAAYEDTGLEPEEIEQLKGEGFGLRLDKRELERYRALGSIERLRELKQADDEGRCVVLQCKIGDTVYSIRHEQVPDDDYRMSFHTEMRIISQKFGLIHADCIGKSVFLTREDAQAALRREQDG